MDATAMYPGGFHPHAAYQDLRPDFKGSAKRYSRAQKSPKYYWIDFGISSQYKSLSPPPREERLWGGDRTVPEFQDNPGSHDPFPVDVYNIGNLIKLDFIQVRLLSSRCSTVTYRSIFSLNAASSLWRT